MTRHFELGINVNAAVAANPVPFVRRPLESYRGSAWRSGVQTYGEWHGIRVRRATGLEWQRAHNKFHQRITSNRSLLPVTSQIPARRR